MNTDRRGFIFEAGLFATSAVLCDVARAESAIGPHTLEEGIRIASDDAGPTPSALSALKGKTILLLGDSIRLGYGQVVREKLKGVAKVFYPEENCRFTYYTLRGICDWVKTVPDPAEVDIVHFTPTGYNRLADEVIRFLAHSQP